MNVGVYNRLCDDHADPVNYHVFADSLEDEGLAALAHAYRWAADHNCRWPFLRHQYERDRNRNRGDPLLRDIQSVYDWQPAPSPTVPTAYWPSVRGVRVPEHSFLPTDIYTQIHAVKDRRYGPEPHDAFKLLADALAALRL